MDAAFCDGFDMDGLITASAAPHIEAPACLEGSSVAVTSGRLTVYHPANDGAADSACLFEADPPANVGSFTLD